MFSSSVLREVKQYPLNYFAAEDYAFFFKIIKKFKPDALAIEDAFFSKNVKSAMVLGHARGSIILAAALNNMTIHEYAPRKVKLSVCGSGAASKEQVSFMVMKILRLEKQLKPYDISDSIAVGLCFINQERLR